jgi:2,4-dienoyl-CoA reductase (NADPH2)
MACTGIDWARGRLTVPIGKRVVIVGGDIQGCRTAEFLVKRGRKVTIVETSEEIGEGLVDTLIKPHLLWRLSSKGTNMINGARCEGVIDEGLNIVGKDGNRQTLEADTIITARSLRPDTKILKGLEGTGPEVHSIGDCAGPALIVDAIEAGSCVGHIV